MVKLKTELVHRFGHFITVDGEKYFVNSEGIIEVKKEVANNIVNGGNFFEFVESNGTEFLSPEIIEAESEFNIDNVPVAENVINEEIGKEEIIDDKDELEYINNLSKKELEDILLEAQIDKKMWQGKKKNDLIILVKDIINK